MTDPRITKEMIEAGAEALYERQYSLAISAGNAPRWGAPDIPHSRDDYREQSLAALEATMQERDTLRAQIPPCDGGCNYNSGPEETCSAHGRPVAEVWEALEARTQQWLEQEARASEAEAERDALAAVVERATKALAFDEDRDYLERIYATQNILAVSLAEHDAQVWDQGWVSAMQYEGRCQDAEAAGQGVLITKPKNPYRAEAARLREEAGR